MDKKLLLLILFLVISSSLSLLTSAYIPSVSHFINCGSNSDITLIPRTFAGDESSDDISLSGKSTTVKSQSPTSDLYSTARVFETTSFYQLETPENGVYMLRIHFLAFSNSLSNAHFNVLASGSFPLLSNFTSPKREEVVIKEFLVPVSGKKFKIYFKPSPGSSIAFVNAIELFILPVNFTTNEATHVSVAKSDGVYKGVLAHSLYTIFKINVGGDNLTPDNDTLWRNWVPDDEYLLNPNLTKKKFYSGEPHYENGGSTEEIAPAYVYKTARELNTDANGGSNLFNVTWRFPVRRNAKHLVRVHFCEILSTSQNMFHFNIYLNSNYCQIIDPYDIIKQLASPFYRDFVVDSDDSGVMNISIGISHDISNRTAFLNGLEIMELISSSGLLPRVKNHRKTNFLVNIGIAVGGLVLLFVLLIGLFLCLKKYRRAKPVEAASEWQAIPLYGMGSTYSRISESTISGGTPLYNLNLGWKQSITDILFATHNFDPKLIIGEGGFGKVYIGTLKDGSKVAVKRSEPGHGQGLSEFETEIMVLSQIRHHHLVSLIGYCDERSEMILVYEFMEKGTLRDHLYKSQGDSENSISQSELSWNKRLEICIGAAKGLDYLHSDRGIIHRDIKSTNILLDEHYVAKVADFGLSRLNTEDQTHVSTDVKGSFGYLDPEYFQCLQITQKTDVYSFGVVLLEVLCARPAIDNLLPRERVNLAEWGMSSLKKGEMANIIDPLLEGKINVNSLKLFGKIVEKCLKGCGVDRPTMHDVLLDLEYALQLQQSSRQRETQDESATEASWVLPAGSIRRLPSHEYDISTADFSEDSRADLRGVLS